MTKLTPLSILLLAVFATGLAVQIVVDTIKDGPLTKTKITCLVGEFDGDNNGIKEIGIIGPDQRTVLVDVTSSGVSKIVNSVSTSNMQAKGKINVHEIDKSYIALTLDPGFDIDSGLYTCHLHYGAGNVNRVATAKENITIAKQDEELVDKYLTKRINTLDEQLESKQKDLDKQRELIMDQKDSIAALQNKEKGLEADLKNTKVLVQTLQKQLKELDAREKYTVAFRALYKIRYNLRTGYTLKFSQVDLNIGYAYSSYTGYFTAPRDGVYAFHVTADYTDSDHGFSFNLVVNNRIVAASYAYDEDGYSFANAAATVVMKKGQTARVTIRDADGTRRLDDDPEYSVFTGHLVKLL